MRACTFQRPGQLWQPHALHTYLLSGDDKTTNHTPPYNAVYSFPRQAVRQPRRLQEAQALAKHLTNMTVEEPSFPHLCKTIQPKAADCSMQE